MKRAVSIAILLIGLDLAILVLSGGVSILGPVGIGGVLTRLALALILTYMATRSGLPSPNPWAYLAILLLLIPLLHFRGYRLRGDGLWYYAYAHSLAFDGDIDLSNNYEGLGIGHFPGSQKVRETGRARYTFPVGAPLTWIPFMALGHVGAWVRNLHGIETAYNGFSDPYLHAVALGNLLIGWLGLLVLDRFLRQWFSPSVSLATTVGIGLGSFLLWYLAFQSIYTHALTFLLVSLFLLRWTQRPKTVFDYAILGCLLGIAACVRWQNAVFGLLPLWSLARESVNKKWRFVAARAGALGGTLFLGILPQLVTWKTIFGRFFIGVPLGDAYMRWQDPFLTETLFSSRHGLFSWSPLLILAAFGVVGFIRRQPGVGWPLAVMLLFLTYINSAVADWWAGGAFGARRFDSALPILALGLATVFRWGTDLVKRRPQWATAGFLGAVILTNLLFMEQYRKGRVATDDTISWEGAAQGMLEDVFDAVGYPFAFPANWFFAWKYDRPKTQYDLLVGKYLFHRQNNMGGVIDIGANDPPFIGNGWSGVKDWGGVPGAVRFAVEPRAGIFVPTDRSEPLRVIIACASPPGVEPQAVEVWLNGHRLGSLLPHQEMTEHAFQADGPWWTRINLLELSPAEDPSGTAYLAVDRLRFERLKH